MKSKLHIVFAVIALALALTACGGSKDELANALAAAGQTAARNQELVASNGQLSAALSAERQKSAKLAVDLANANKVAQAERNAKWRAKNEVVGAKKVAEKAVITAHAVGVKQTNKVKPKP